jgi:hypothetical protein
MTSPLFASVIRSLVLVTLKLKYKLGLLKKIKGSLKEEEWSHSEQKWYSPSMIAASG